MRLTHLFLSTVLTVAAITALAAEAPSIKVSDAWVRSGPASAKVMAAYLTIENSATTPDQLIGMKSESFAKVEAHRTEIRDGIAKMVAVGPVDIPAGGTVKFEPNGMHLMLMGAAPSVKNAATVAVQLTFKNAGNVSVDIPIKKSAEPVDPHQHHH